jgi:hypothetical protein
MGMVPSESPVFLNPDGSIVGKPKVAGGNTSQPPALRTPADGTVGEAVDTLSAELPTRLPADYDPALADAAQRQAQAANQTLTAQSTVTEAQRAASLPVTISTGAAGLIPTSSATTSSGSAAPAKPKVVSQWSDTVIDVSGLSSTDSGLTAVPTR